MVVDLYHLVWPRILDGRAGSKPGKAGFGIGSLDGLGGFLFSAVKWVVLAVLHGLVRPLDGCCHQAEFCNDLWSGRITGFFPGWTVLLF